MADQPDFAGAKQYALDRLGKELSPRLVYHSLHHTAQEVLPAVQRLAVMEGIDGEAFALLETAAWFHDLGFTEQRQDHEDISIRIAEQILPGLGFSSQQLHIIIGMIQATKLPQRPVTRLEEILADADLDTFGREDFFPRSLDLRVELASFGQVVPLEQWYQRQSQMLRSHRYFTASARLVRDAQKLCNLLDLEEKLEKLRSADKEAE